MFALPSFLVYLTSLPSSLIWSVWMMVALLGVGGSSERGQGVTVGSKVRKL